MSKAKKKYERETLLFMSEVDQALYGRGRRLAYLSSTCILLMIIGLFYGRNLRCSMR